MNTNIIVNGLTTQSNRQLRVPNGTRRPNTNRPCPADTPTVIYLNRTLRTSSGERRSGTPEPPIVINRILRMPIGTRR